MYRKIGTPLFCWTGDYRSSDSGRGLFQRLGNDGFGDLIVGHSQEFFQDQLVVLSQRRCGEAWAIVISADVKHMAGVGVYTGLDVVQFTEELAVLQLRVLGQVPAPLVHAGGHAFFLNPVHHVFRRQIGCP